MLCVFLNSLARTIKIMCVCGFLFSFFRCRETPWWYVVGGEEKGRPQPQHEISSYIVSRLLVVLYGAPLTRGGCRLVAYPSGVVYVFVLFKWMIIQPVKDPLEVACMHGLRIEVETVVVIVHHHRLLNKSGCGCRPTSSRCWILDDGISHPPVVPRKFWRVMSKLKKGTTVFRRRLLFYRYCVFRPYYNRDGGDFRGVP